MADGETLPDETTKHMNSFIAHVIQTMFEAMGEMRPDDRDEEAAFLKEQDAALDRATAEEAKADADDVVGELARLQRKAGGKE